MLFAWFVLAVAIFIGHTLGNMARRATSSGVGRWSGLGLGLVLIVLVIGVLMLR